jgi:endonuclease/exonuclease/phosphatase family metal-dependent hydrolase
MGDFNHWRPGSESLKRLTAVMPNMITAATWHTRLPVVPFDRIVASSHFRVLGNEVVVNDQTQVASDHLPLKAWLALD